jgi:hypothetical protein
MNFFPCTLENAVKLCRIADFELREKNWTVGLTGSTLFKGHSEKDYDIICYPMKSLLKDKCCKEDVINGFISILESDVKSLVKRLSMWDTMLHPSSPGPDDLKDVWCVTFDNGLRIDFFFLQ